MSRFAVQAAVAESKRKHPEEFCPLARCLWRTGGGYCPRHATRTSRGCDRPGCTRTFTTDSGAKCAGRHFCSLDCIDRDPALIAARAAQKYNENGLAVRVDPRGPGIIESHWIEPSEAAKSRPRAAVTSGPDAGAVGHMTPVVGEGWS